nr:unnamed protein product [Callosobruchus analis]
MASGSSFLPVKKLPNTDRYREVQKVFQDVFQITPDFYVRVPGRVNLIGEHIDYCGYPVCPMALDQHIFLAVSKTNDKMLKLHNIDPTFKDFECSLENFEISIGEGKPEWYQYFLCGVKGILECKDEMSSNDVVGMKVVVSGDIPHSAGLSSSSALVSAAAVSTAYARNVSILIIMPYILELLVPHARACTGEQARRSPPRPPTEDYVRY